MITWLNERPIVPLIVAFGFAVVFITAGLLALNYPIDSKTSKVATLVALFSVCVAILIFLLSVILAVAFRYE